MYSGTSRSLLCKEPSINVSFFDFSLISIKSEFLTTRNNLPKLCEKLKQLFELHSDSESDPEPKDTTTSNKRICIDSESDDNEESDDEMPSDSESESESEDEDKDDLIDTQDTLTERPDSSNTSPLNSPKQSDTKKIKVEPGESQEGAVTRAKRAAAEAKKKQVEADLKCAVFRNDGTVWIDCF